MSESLTLQRAAARAGESHIAGAATADFKLETRNLKLRAAAAAAVMIVNILPPRLNSVSNVQNPQEPRRPGQQLSAVVRADSAARCRCPNLAVFWSK